MVASTFAVAIPRQDSRPDTGQALVPWRPKKLAKKDVTVSVQSAIGPAFAPALACYDMVWSSMQLATTQCAQKDEEIMEVSGMLLGQHTMHVMSKETMADKTGVERKRVTRVQQRLAAALLAVDRHALMQLDEAIIGASRRVDLIHYYDFACHDETPSGS